MTSGELFSALFGAVKPKFEPHWWPNYGTFEVLVGAVLVQNTKWEQVQKALENLRNAHALSLDGIVSLDKDELVRLIKPSGFYNVKAKRLSELCAAIKSKFDSFEEFVQGVDREWLLSQKGIGAESCDSILCYACGRDEMVVDSYTLRIFEYFGYEFSSYDEAKEWLGALDLDEMRLMCGVQDENEMFCLYHGLIVEFCKVHLRGRKFSEEGRAILDSLRG